VYDESDKSSYGMVDEWDDDNNGYGDGNDGGQ
jgi:hypothetical protein